MSLPSAAAEPGFRADLAAQTARRRRVWRGLALLVLALVLAALAGGAFWLRHWVFHDLPPTPDAQTLSALGRAPAVVLMDRNGVRLDARGPIYGDVVQAEDLPHHLVDAFLAIEDQRFYSHKGVDVKGIARAVWVNLRAGRPVQGGSTLTQQLVKNTVLSPERTLRRKLQESVLAWRLEQAFTKPEILEFYLNRIFFGARAYGVDAAARRYFGKPAAQVTLAEAALLAGLPKAPSRYAPTENPGAARARRDVVLDLMREQGRISPADHADAIAEPVRLVPLPPEPGVGYAFDRITETLEARIRGPAADLVVRTTLDAKLQALGERLIADTLQARGPALKAEQAALVAMTPDGGVLAHVGGLSYDDSQFDRAGQALRQPGSAFKPFVYAAAFEGGLSARTVRRDGPVQFGDWRPKNFGLSYRGPVRLEEAFYRSLNTVAASLGMEVGPARVAAFAERVGLPGPLPAIGALSLGAVEVSLLDLVSAYAVFSSEGLKAQPHFIASVSDARGRTLFRRPSGPGPRVYDQDLALEMTQMLAAVVDKGTGKRAQLEGRTAAGKTGTSQDFRDAWFIGFTPEMVTGVWVGNDDDSPMNRVSGGGLPAEIWRAFMAEALAANPPAAFNQPVPRAVRERRAKLHRFYTDLAVWFDAQTTPAATPAAVFETAVAEGPQ